MKIHYLYTLLKAAIVLTAVLVVSGLLYFPQTEGRAVNLDLVSIYTDPLILYVYVGSIPFFIGLYQCFKLLNLIDENKILSQRLITTLRNIEIVSMSQIGFIVLALLYIRFFAQGEDPAGPIVLGMIVSFIAAIIGIGAAVFQRSLQTKIHK